MNLPRSYSDMESGRIVTAPQARVQQSGTAHHHQQQLQNNIFRAPHLTKEMLHKLQNTSDLNNNSKIRFCGYQLNIKRISVLIALTVLFLLSSVSVFVFWTTQLYRDLILQQLVISNTSSNFNSWKGPSNSLVKVYIYNYTNAKEVARGYQRKLNVQELGPYTYQEQRTLVNVNFNEDGSTVKYQQKIAYKFLPELSRGRKQGDKVVVPNIPMLSAAALSKKSYYLTRLGMSALFRHLNAEPFVQLPADRFIFGYDDDLFNLAKGVLALSKPLPFEKFGLLATRAGLSDDVIEVSTGKHDVNTIGTTQSLNGHAQMGKWLNDECDRVGGIDGVLFPPKTVQKKAPLELFYKDMCRKMPIEYESSQKLLNNLIPSNRYVLPKNVFGHPDISNPSNQGYCDLGGNCSLHGLFNMTPCSFGTPLFISHPRFMWADPKLRESIDGMDEAVPERHRSFLDIHPFTGVAEQGWIRLQTNIQVQKSLGMTELGMFAEDIILPIAWMEFGLDAEQLPAEAKQLLYDCTYLVDGFETAAQYGSILIALFTMMGIIGILRNSRA